VDIVDFSRYFAGLLIVMGLLVGFAVIVRRGWLPGGFPALGNLSAQRLERRLAVKESLILDPRRRVVIVKADDQEHVLLLGPERETLLASHAAHAAPVFMPEMPDTAGKDPDATEADDGFPASAAPPRREASA
jgi:flagellar protein FliO/FliZ